MAHLVPFSAAACRVTRRVVLAITSSFIKYGARHMIHYDTAHSTAHATTRSRIRAERQLLSVV